MENNELQRGLSARQIQMIALGGTIGVGLFMGATSTIKWTGPSVILAYLIAGIFLFLIMRAMGEMIYLNPTTGSFATFASDYIHPAAGYMTAWSNIFQWIVVGMSEVIAVGEYMKFWFPELPTWIPGVIAILLLMAANLFSVKAFGEFEFWFALIKVVTIILMIIAGFGLIFLFSEEIGDLFSIKVIAISTAIVAVGYIGLSLIIRGIAYLTTRRNLEELEPNNYLDHVNDDEETNHTEAEKSSSNIKNAEKTGVATASTVGVAKNDTENTVADEQSIHEGTEKTEPQHHIGNQTESNHDEDHDITSESVESAESVKQAPQSDDLTNDSNEDEIEQSLKEPATYKEDRRSSVVIDAEKHIEKTEEQSSDKNK